MEIAFIGGGHMTHALVGGLVKKEIRNIMVVERHAERRERLEKDYGVETTVNMANIVADIIIVAVRPGQVRGVVKTLDRKALLISIAAGVRCRHLSAWSQDRNQPIVRCMPNTPSQVGEGMTFCYGMDIDQFNRQRVDAIFSAVGQTVWVEDEDLLDVATAVSGSGPAYVYYFIEAMQKAAKQMSLPDDVARQAILQTLRGAVAMVEETGQDPVALRLAVAVKGGTTEKAINCMESHQLHKTVQATMDICASRAREIGEEMGNP